MKKLVFVLIIALLYVNYLHAQTTEKLTNSTIIKMVKVKLSDDLIIDEINNSQVNFNVSTDSLIFLSNKNVSFRVIQVMKTAHDIQNPTSTAIVQMKPEMPPIKEPSIDMAKTESDNDIPIETSTNTINAVSYVIPMKELINFFDYEFNLLAGVIQVWDKRIRNSIEKGNQINKTMLQVEKELADKKNADSKGYSNEIIILKKKLSESREKYTQYKDYMLTDGMKIAKKIKQISIERDKSIKNKFSEVSLNVKKSHPDPSLGEISKTITIPKQKINNDVVYCVSSITDILFFYQNEIVSLKDIIAHWNGKAAAIIQKDSELRKQLEPLKKEMENYQNDRKKNKAKISELKKQCTKLDKERKRLANLMVDDSKELSKYLKQICIEVQSSVKVRFSDIIENINYSYQDQF